MYLHVDEDNKPAFNLFKSEGYNNIDHKWDPFWSCIASKIGHCVNLLLEESITLIKN